MENKIIEVKSMDTIIDEIESLSSEGYRQMIMCLMDRMGFAYSSDLPPVNLGCVGFVTVYSSAERHFLDSTTYALTVGRTEDICDPLTVRVMREKLRPYEHGILIITGKFSDKVKKEALKGNIKITLIDGRKLVNLLATFNMFGIYNAFGQL